MIEIWKRVFQLSQVLLCPNPYSQHADICVLARSIFKIPRNINNVPPTWFPVIRLGLCNNFSACKIIHLFLKSVSIITSQNFLEFLPINYFPYSISVVFLSGFRKLDIHCSLVFFFFWIVNALRFFWLSPLNSKEENINFLKIKFSSEIILFLIELLRTELWYFRFEAYGDHTHDLAMDRSL